MQWWQERTPRERLILVIGGTLVLLSMLFVLVIEPMHRESDRLRVRIASLQADLERVKAAAAEAERLRASAGGSTADAVDGSLVSFLDVVDAERTLLEVERKANAIRAESLAVSVALIKSIGGKW